MKAIETRYKGYRFRSRLEARWAVFFDSLGVKWEYEFQGFKTEAGAYLPDFYLPASDLYVEIKPLVDDSTITQRSIYMAGRVTKSGWRHDLVDGLRDAVSGAEQWRELAASSGAGSPVLTSDGLFVYRGPFAISCDHGCSHGDGLHGVARGGVGCGSAGEIDGRDQHGGPRAQPSEILTASLAQIRAADVVFAWIDDPDSAGTLIELGYAKGRAKEIRVGFGDDLLSRSMWFAAECGRSGVFKSAGAAYTQMLSTVDLNSMGPSAGISKIIALARGGTRPTLLIEGTPFEHRTTLFRAETGSALKRDQILVDKQGLICDSSARSFIGLHPGIGDAINVATQARFEHGEQP